MREQLCLLLAKHAGKTITRELAVEIVREACHPLRLTGMANEPALTAVVGHLNFDAPQGVVSLNGANPEERRHHIRLLTDSLNALPESQQFVPEIRHTFLRGIYMREMFIPRGTVLVGKVHRLDCINLVSRGDISVMTEAGAVRVQAGHQAVSPAGTQKVGFAHEDTIFINVFRTDATDVETIDEVLAFPATEPHGLNFEGAIP